MAVKGELDAFDGRRYAGFPLIAQSYLLSSIAGKSDTAGPKCLLIVVPDIRSLEQLQRNIAFFLGSQDLADSQERRTQVLSLLGWEVLPFDPLSPPAAQSAARLHTLSSLAKRSVGAGNPEEGPLVVVATAESLLQRLVPKDSLQENVRCLRRGQELDRDTLISWLDTGGYLRTSLVEESGQMAVRGAVVDFFPPGSLRPIRVELFDDIVDSIRPFEAGDQRSCASLESFEVIPVREVFGDVVDEAKHFASLRARASELSIPQTLVKPIEAALSAGAMWPGLEHLQPLLFPKMDSIWDYLPNDSLVALIDEPGIEAACDTFEEIVKERVAVAEREGRLYPEPTQTFIPSRELLAELDARSDLRFEGSSFFEKPDDLEADALGALTPKRAKLFTNAKLATALQVERSKTRPLQPLAAEIELRLRDGLDVIFVAGTEKRAKRLSEVVRNYAIETEQYPGTFREWRDSRSGPSRTARCFVLIGEISSGFRDEKSGFMVIAERELFPETSARPTLSQPNSVRRFLGSTSQLNEDDYVVHVDYGIGMYRGLRQMSVESKIGDFLELEYANKAKLFVPVENIGKVQKYSAAEGVKPSLSKLGGKTWEKTKRKVQENVAQLAGQLLQTMATRELDTGYSFGEETSDEVDFAAAFPFEETADQSNAIKDVLADMASGRSMDRLVCGDVGYGKTEVAMRAAFKAASAGKQTAILVPTTVLAEQHYASFLERFAGTAVEIRCVSRFFKPAENKATLAAVAEGTVDVIIGTHRLLQKDVAFADLGLVIVDEEHRFGVAHKEKLKRLKSDIDILTLTATPIPRTLHMSLSGIRDLSLIETPPVNRQVIRTYLATYEDGIVREAIMRELGRGGQVFYIHNRVKNIALVADELQELVPQARIAFGHGQMKDRELEAVMHRFVSHEIDILVSTTIVESGLDIPNANTIIIRHADRFGLAELYQLRGRVGRSARRAYAYLLVSDPKTLTGDARKRLEVLRSLDDLGIGFRLALQDMEIRGAGNLLGKDQSGQIALVGYELYSRVLKEAVEELKRQRRNEEQDVGPRMPDVDPEVKIGFPAHIPPSYIPDIAERLILYQRLIELRSSEDAHRILEEIEDRFGRPPTDVYVLLELMAFRGVLKRASVLRASYRDEQLSVQFHPETPLDLDRVRGTLANDENLRLSSAGVLTIDLRGVEVDSPRVLRQRAASVFQEFGLAL